MKKIKLHNLNNTQTMNTKKKLKIGCYGEVLWDVFNNEKKIGGAPLNVALRIKSFGYATSMISCVGNDADGENILKYLKEQKLNTDGIIINEEFPTGLVTVLLDDKGSATYTINYPSAWDKISYTDTLKDIAISTDAFIYGSLACRDEISRTTLYKLLNTPAYKVFDVNLRKPHYTQKTLEELMFKADFIKFNDEELPEIALALGSGSNNLKENIMFISEKTNTKAICVTLGKDGALLLWNNQFYSNTGYTITVADTVGAGDSFLASIITKLLSGSNPQSAIDFACAVGSLVASKHGANPIIEESEIETILNSKRQL